MFRDVETIHKALQHFSHVKGDRAARAANAEQAPPVSNAEETRRTTAGGHFLEKWLRSFLMFEEGHLHASIIAARNISRNTKL